MKKRLLSLVLAIMMVLTGLTPALPVLADQPEMVIEQTEELLPAPEESPEETLPAPEEIPEEAEALPEEEAAEETDGEEEPSAEEVSDEAFLTNETTLTPVYINDGEGEVPVIATTVDEAGGWSFDAATMTITLNGFDGKSIRGDGDFTIVLEGENTITVPAAQAYALESKGMLTVTAESTADVLNINVLNPTVSTTVIKTGGFGESQAFYLNGGTVNLTATVSATVTVKGVDAWAYINNDASYNHSLTGTSNQGYFAGFTSATYFNTSSACELSLQSQHTDSYNVYSCYYNGSGDLTLSAGKTSAGIVNRNVFSTFSLKEEATGDIVVEGCLELVSLSSSVQNHYRVKETGDFLWSYYTLRPGDPENKIRCITDLDGTPLQNFTLEYAESRELTFNDSPLYDIPAGLVGENYGAKSYVTPMYGCYGGKGTYSFALADGSTLPDGLTLDYNSGYISGKPTAPCAEGSYTLVVTAGDETDEVTVNYGEIIDIDYFATINGTKINLNANNSGDGWSYDATTKAFTLSGYNGGPIISEKDLSIILDGENTITVPVNGVNALKSTGKISVNKKTATVRDILHIKLYDASVPTYLIQTGGYGAQSAFYLDGGIVDIDINIDDSKAVYAVAAWAYINNDAIYKHKIVSTNVNGYVCGLSSAAYFNTRGNCSLSLQANEASSHNAYSLYYNGSGDLTLSTGKTAAGVANCGIYSGFVFNENARGNVIVNGYLENVTSGLNYRVKDAEGFMWKLLTTRPGDTFQYRYLTDLNGTPMKDFTLEYVEDLAFKAVDSPLYDIDDCYVGTTFNYNPNVYPTYESSCQGGTGSYRFYLAENSPALPEGLSISSINGYLSGTVTAPHDAGYFIVEARSGEEKSTFRVDYGEITYRSYVESITLDQEEVVFDPSNDDIITLTATLLPADADNCDVTWVSNVYMQYEELEADLPNQRMAFFFPPRVPGQYTITAFSKMNGLNDSCTVYVREYQPDVWIEDGYLLGLEPDINYLINGEIYRAEQVFSYEEDDEDIYGVPLELDWIGTEIEIIRTSLYGVKMDSAPLMVEIPEDATLVLENPLELELSHDYLILSLADDEPVMLEAWAIADDRDYDCEDVAFEWYSNDDGAIVTVEDGVITPVGVGTTHVICELEVGGHYASAYCRVDVIARQMENNVVGNAHLLQKSVTTNIYSYNYATVDFIWDLKNNGDYQVMMAAPSGNGNKVSRAHFENALLDEYFRLFVVDDNTVEIIPCNDLSPEEIKSLKSSYKTRLILETDTGKTYTTPETLTIKIDKKLPSVKASAVKFNSYNRMDILPLVFTCKAGEVQFAVVDTEKGGCPDWLFLCDDGKHVMFTGNAQKYSGKLYLNAFVEGYYEPVPVTVSVSAAVTPPKVKLSSSSITVSPYDSLGTRLQLLSSNKKIPLSDLNIVDVDVMPYGLLSEKELKTYAANQYYYVDYYDTETGSFTLYSTGYESAAGKVLLRVTVDIGNGCTNYVTVPLTVKVSNKAPVIKLSKTKVTMNPFVENGDMAIIKATVTPGDYDFGGSFKITVLDSKKNPIFGNAHEMPLRITQYGETIEIIHNPGFAEPGATYYVQVGLYGDFAKPVNITVKVLDDIPKNQPSFTVSAKGSIDTSRREDTAITLTVKPKNCNTDYPSMYHYVTVWDSQQNDVTDLFDYWLNENGTVTLKLQVGAELDMTQKYTVSTCTSIGMQFINSTNQAKLTIKQGTLKVTPSVKTVNLYRNDKYSLQEVKLIFKDSHDPIAHIEMLNAEDSFFEVIPSGPNPDLLIGFKNGKIAPNIKNGTVKVAIWTVGNTTEKPNATVSISVKVVGFKNP